MIVPGSNNFQHLQEASFRGPTYVKLWGPKVDFLNIHYTWVNCPSILWHLKVNVTQFSQQSVVHVVV